MHIRFLSTTMMLVGLLAVACDDGTQEQSPGEVLARDSSLASDLKQIDTSSFAEAADVAMAFDPDSAMAPPAAAVAAPAVPMRVDRSAPASAPSARGSAPATDPASSAAPTPSPTTPTDVAPRPPAAPAPRSVARPSMRPAPATIHPDPLPRRPMPAAGTASRTSPSDRGAATSSAAAILEKVPGATLPAPVASDPCQSPAAPEQRRCLMAHLARSDVGLDRTYQALISDLKRQAGTPPGAPEPQSVQELRQAQRAWLVYRDTECRRRNRGREGPLWAPVRAQCLGEFSGVREAELARARRQ